MSQKDIIEYQLKLGMIIKFVSQSNDNLHNKKFLIDYLDNDNNKIIDDNFDRYQLTINDGKLSDERIEEIHILEEPIELGYARQHNLKVNSYWSFTFGGNVPEVINGEITNLEEDCIEITTYPNKDVIHIDFAYKGIPLNIPLEEPIVPFVPPKKELEDIEEEITLNSDLDDLENILFDDDDDLIYEYDNDEIEKNKENMIIEADEIKFGEQIGITQLINVSDEEKRYDIDTQLNDLLDDLLSYIPTNKRKSHILNKINLNIIRFKELRDQYSNIDGQGIVTSIKKYTSNYKPLSESLFYLNQPLKWLTPIVKNQLELFNTDEMSDDNIDIITPINTTQQFISDHMNIYDLYFSDRIPNKQNKYIYLHEQTFKPHFKPPFNKENIIIEKKINNNFEVFIDNLDDMNSSTAAFNLKGSQDKWEDSSDINITRFNTTLYTKGLNYITYDNKNKKKTLIKPLTFNDTMSIKGFMMYPISVIKYSTMYLKNMNIYEKCKLHEIPYIKSFYTNKDKYISEYILTENKEIDDTSFDSLKKMNKILFKEEEEISGRENNETYVEFLNKMIPNIKTLFLNLIKHINIKDSLSYYSLINLLEPFMIYNKHITYKQYEELTNFINISCNKYITSIVNNINSFNKFLKNGKIISYNVPSKLSSFFKEKNELENMDKNWYDINDSILSSEYLKNIIVLDNGKLLYDAITLSDISLIQNINIEEKLQELKEKIDNDREKFIDKREQKCSVFTLAKKFKNVEEIVKDNNNDQVEFDKEYDDTRYDIYKELGHIKAISNKKEQRNELISYLMTELGISAKNAERDADTMLRGKKIVQEGDYGVLDTGDYDYRYYIRKKNKWHLDEEFNGKFIDEINFCNTQKNCLTVNKSCVSKKEGSLMIESELISDIINKIESDFKINIDILTDQIKLSLTKNMNNIILLKKQKYLNFNKYDQQKYNYAETKTDDIDIEESPYMELCDKILSQEDIIKKYNDILIFINLYCSKNIIETDEISKYWYFCNETKLKLIPTFYFDLANGFFNDNYKETLDKICSERGTISDDGDKIVDKYSGYFIQHRNFENIITYEKSGKQIISHEILDLSIEEKRKEEDENILKEDKAEYKTETAKQIDNILKTLDVNIGVDTKKYHTLIIRIIKLQIDEKLSSVKAYNIKRKQAEKLGKKIQTYDKAFNNLLMYFTLSLYIIIVQSSIPHIKKGKAFYGCKESLLGFPIEKPQQYGIIHYITCVALKIAYKDSKTETSGHNSPWNALPKLTKKKAEKYKKSVSEKITKYIKDIFLNMDEINKLIKEKRKWLTTSNIKTMEEILTEKWKSFLPILEPFEIPNLNNINNSFENSLIKSFKNQDIKTYDYLNKLYGKIILYSLSFQSNMQTIIDKQPLILKSLGDVHFLENACCDDKPNISTYEYFVDKNKDIEKDNIICNKLSNLYNKYTKLNTPLFNSLENTKITFMKDFNEITEETIYLSMIKYCKFNSGIELDKNLKQVCNNNISAYDNNDTIKKKIKIMKSEGHNYSINSLKLLFKIITKPTIKKTILYNKVHPKTFFEKTLKRINTVNKRQEKIDDILEELENLFDRHESHYTETKDDDVDHFIRLISKKNEELIEKIIKNLKLTKRSKKPIDFLNNLEHFKERGDNLYINKEDETGYFIYKLFTNMLININKIFPNIILNKMSYKNKNIKIPKHWKLSRRHQNEIIINISDNFSNLAKYYNDEEINQLLKMVLNTGENILDFNNSLPFLPEFNNFKTICNGKIIKCIGIYTFLYSIDNYYNLIDEIYDIESEDRVLRGKRETMIKKVSDLLIDYLNNFTKYKKIVNKSNLDIMKDVLKVKDKEKTHITTTYEDLTIEQRKVVKVMQNHKLGEWSLGESKAVYMYDPKQYDKERDFIEKTALLEYKHGIRDEVTDMLQEVYDMDEIYEKENIEQRINEDEYNISHLPEDDDFGDRDGDEYY